MHHPCRWMMAALVALLLASAPAGATEPSPEGNWLPRDKGGVIELYRCGEALCGRLLWLRLRKDDANPKGLDLNNPDPARRDRPLCGLTFMQGFKPSGTAEWSGGAIYDPESGNTYHAKIRLEPDGTLVLRGYIGISLLGRSETWTRDTQPVPPCPSR